MVPYTGMVSAFTRIVREEGIRGLYRFVLTIFVKIEVLNGYMFSQICGLTVMSEIMVVVINFCSDK